MNSRRILEVSALTCAVAFAIYWIKQRENGRQCKKEKKLRLSSDEIENELVKDIAYTTVEPDKVTNPRKLTYDGEGQPILVVGVCGGTGSGKTTLSKAIIRDYGKDNVSYLSHDYYYKDLKNHSLKQRAQHNFDHPDSLDTALMVDHLKRLKNGATVEVPIYDFSTHSRCEETQRMVPNNVILVEGILLFADPELVELMDIKIFVETAADIRFIRRLRRDISERGRTAESVIEQYMKTVRPMHNLFVESSKRVADIIIPTGVNSVALDMIISRLRSFTADA